MEPYSHSVETCFLVNLFFWFVRGEDGDHDWSTVLDSLHCLVSPSYRYVRVEGQVVTLADMTAADYVESDPLDLDHPSSASG
jgi:hypothetical protein